MDAKELTVTIKCCRPWLLKLAAYGYFFSERLFSWMFRKSFKVGY